MHRIIVSLVIASFAIFSLSAQDLDQILNDHFKASAQDKLSNITTVTLKGKLSSMGMETELILYQSRPNKLRFEAKFAGTDIIQTFNGIIGWTYAPGMGITEPRALGADELKGLLMQAEMDSPLWDYRAKGKNVELLGTTEDGSAYKLKLIAPEGDEAVLWISKETSLLTKLITKQMANGMEMEIETDIKDYKKVDGIPTAHYIGTKTGGQLVSTFTFESVEFNKPLDAALFEKPVVE